jgi:hypothetical protein
MEKKITFDDEMAHRWVLHHHFKPTDKVILQIISFQPIKLFYEIALALII